MTTARDILDACLKEEKRFISLLKLLVTLETPPRDRKAHKKLYSLLAKPLGDLGYETNIYSAKNCGGTFIARQPQRSEKGYQLMLGHIDTVWPKNTLASIPFKREGNTITGPGVFDMKAGVAMMVTALKVLEKLELEPELQPVIFLGSDEESGSIESREQILRIARAMKRVFVMEPALDRDGKLKTRRKGIGQFTIKIKGVSSHAGLDPEKGKSAIHELSILVQKLFELNDPEQGISVNVGEIEGGIGSNVIAPESKATVDIRIPTKKAGERIITQIRALEPTIKGVSIDISGGVKRPPLVQNQRNLVLWKAAQKWADTVGIDLQQGISGGGSDGSFTSMHTATLDGLGAVGDGAHAPTERIFLEQTLQRIGLLAYLLVM